MKLVHKNHLEFIEGRLIDTDTNEVLSLPALAYEYNEVLEVQGVNAFVRANRKAIEASEGKTLEYVTPKPEVPAFEPVELPATPVQDEEAAKREALALEFLNTQGVVDVNAHLARYGALAKWFASEYVEVVAGPPSLFMGNVLELTELDVRQAVTAFQDADARKLRNQIVVT